VANKRLAPACVVLILISLPILFFGSDRYLDVCFSGGGFIRCMFGFSVGVLTYLGFARGAFDALKEKSIAFTTIIEAVLCIGCLTLVGMAGAGPFSLLCPFLFAAAIIPFAHERGMISRFLLIGPMLLVGTLSYSIYMVHEFLLARFVNLASVLARHVTLPIIQAPSEPFTFLSANGWTFGADMAAFVFYAAVLGFSWLSYKFVEVPWRNWSRSRSQQCLINDKALFKSV
jgi:peptidoglycan/LPS O-acetylase OafA/YrhL